MRLAQLYPIQGQSIDHISIPKIFNHLEDPESNFRSHLREAPQEEKVFCENIDRLLQSENSFGRKKIARDTDSKAFQCVMRLQKQASQHS